MTDAVTKRQAEQIMHLSSSYTMKDVDHAYNELVKKYHPDLQPKDEASQQAAHNKMVEINQAYDHLKRLFKQTTATTLQIEEATSNSSASSATSPYSSSTSSKASKPSSAASSTTATSTTPSSASSAASTASSSAFSTAGTSPTPTPGPGWDAAKEAWEKAQQTGDNVFQTTQTFTDTPPTMNTTTYSSTNFTATPSTANPVTTSTPAPPKHSLIYRFFAHFPYRLVFLVIIFMLFASPDHAGMDYITHFGTFQWVTLYKGNFMDFIIWHGLLFLAIVNLFKPFITNVIREIILAIIGGIENIGHKSSTT